MRPVSGLARILAGIGLVLLSAWDHPAFAEAATPVTIFAAASTRQALEWLQPEFQARGLKLVPVYAGSGALARQIEQDAPADLYLSAHPRWMAYLKTENRIDGDAVPVAANRLVLAGSGVEAEPQEIKDALGHALGQGRLAIGNPDIVPAGQYAKEALQALGIWDAARTNLAMGASVTGVLALVSRGEAPAGIVYQSDLTRAEGLHVLAIFPPALHSPIVYEAAIVTGHDTAESRLALSLLTEAEGRRAFEAAGFLAPEAAQ